MSGIDSDLIRGHIDTIILKTLFDGDKYGYEILDEVSKKSGGSYELKQPTLYSCLKRLEGQGLISSYWVDSEIGGKRHYYCLTDAGKDTYKENQQNWLKSRQIIDNLIWENAPTMPQKEIVTADIQRSQEQESPTPSVIDYINPLENNSIQESHDEDSPQTNDQESVFVETDANSISDNTYSEEKSINLLEENIENTQLVDSKVIEEDAESVNTSQQSIDESITTESEPENESVIDIMALLGHYDNSSSIDEEIDKLNDATENLENINNEYSSSNDFLENFVKNYMTSDEVEVSQVSDESQEEINDDFNLDMSKYMNDDDSYFSNNITKDKVNFITPNVVIDDLQKRVEEEYTSSHIEFINDDEVYNNSSFEENISSPTEVDEQPQEESITPTYLSFGEEIVKQQDEYDSYSSGDDTLYSESTYDSNTQSNDIYNSNDDLDTLYSNSDFSFTSEPVNDCIEDNKVEEDSQTSEELKTSYSQVNDSQDNPSKEYYQTSYNEYQSLETVQPKFTDEQSKRKLAELSVFAKESSLTEEETKEETLFDADEFLARNKVVKNYDRLINDFEKEGLSVRVHNKLVKENKDSRSYVQTNKIKMTRNWISFCFIAMILAITFAVMHESGTQYYGFSYKYFVIGLTVALIVPIISTIIFALNPYKKNVASFSPALSFMLSALVFVQLLLIVYCVNLQLGFYSFAQEYYNHLHWIIPAILCLYPILNSIVHTSLYRSKNFHS